VGRKINTKTEYKNFRERVNLEDLGVDERIILKPILNKYDERARNRDQCSALMNMVSNLQVL
jgi:hypothetical protein